MSALFATGEPFSAAEIVAAMTRLHAESETYLAAIPAAEFAAPQGEIYRATLRETGATAGRFAPSAQAAPADPAAWQQEVLAKWRGAVSGLALRIPRWSEPALDRYRLPHPLLGQLTVREMLLFTVYHNVHHLEQVAGRR